MRALNYRHWILVPAFVVGLLFGLATSLSARPVEPGQPAPAEPAVPGPADWTLLGADAPFGCDPAETGLGAGQRTFLAEVACAQFS